MPSADFVPNIPPRALLQTKESNVAKDDIDPEEIEDEIDLEADDDLDILEDEIDDDALLDDDIDDDDDDSLGATVVRKATDDDDDDDMVAPDDVEEDLAEILKDRLSAEEIPEDEDEVVEQDDRGSADDALQPKRADEVLCNSCFMLVRQNAPVCPMGDDACPTIKR